MWGGPGLKLAEWVPHVRAFCFDGSDIFEGNRCFLFSLFCFLACELCARPMIRLNRYAVLPIDCPVLCDIFIVSHIVMVLHCIFWH